MNRVKKFFNWGSRILILTMLVSITASGCEPLRKKFTRKKKEDKKLSGNFVPVLDPVDYPPSTFSSEKEYDHRFNLWKIWYKEYRATFTEPEYDTSKKETYTLNQLYVQLEKMEELLREPKQDLLGAQKESLQKVIDRMQTPKALRNTNGIKSSVKRIDQAIRGDFHPREVENYLK